MILRLCLRLLLDWIWAACSSGSYNCSAAAALILVFCRALFSLACVVVVMLITAIFFSGGLLDAPPPSDDVWSCWPWLPWSYWGAAACLCRCIAAAIFVLFRCSPLSGLVRLLTSIIVSCLPPFPLGGESGWLFLNLSNLILPLFLRAMFF